MLKATTDIVACALAGLCTFVIVMEARSSGTDVLLWETAANPVVPLPASPLGTDIDLAGLVDAPTPARVRLGRWLFYDRRVSRDGTISCASCHTPDHAFSNRTAAAIGIGGQKSRRKPPALINLASALYPHFFRDGRVATLEAQALEPIASPAEMGNSHEGMVQTVHAIAGYRRYFAEAFGTSEVTKERVTKAIADYERTRMSGNSPWDRWRRHRDESAVSDQAKTGHALFFGKAGCNQCHLGNNFTDSVFHNLGVGWDRKSGTFRDVGRYAVTKQLHDTGAFKTPTLREVTKHAPYMHDGSVATLRDVILLYNRGGEGNPYLDRRIRPLNLADAEIAALVAFLEALDGEGYTDTAPATFPQ